MNTFYDATGGALAANNQTGGGVSLVPAANNQMMVNTRSQRQIVIKASEAALADHCGATITGMAIQHTATLSWMADQAAAMSPAAEPHVRELVGEYVGTAKAIVSGWNR
jgi:hypothetical protein